MLELQKANGTKTTILNIPAWDFHWQLTYFLATPVHFDPGDKLRVSCTFDNTPERQPIVNGAQGPPHDVNWGERTSDEMCVANILASE